MGRLTTAVLWIAFAATCSAAFVFAFAPAPASKLASTVDTNIEQQMFERYASREQSARASAAKNFPTDKWSQDDDFHFGELKTTMELSAQHQTSYTVPLSAHDEGLRAHWPGSDTMQKTVPPCRPRAIY